MATHHETLASLFTDIADAIREKTGSTASIVANEFPTAIRGIETGISIEGEVIQAVASSDISKGSFVGTVEGTGSHSLTSLASQFSYLASRVIELEDGKFLVLAYNNDSILSAQVIYPTNPSSNGSLYTENLVGATNNASYTIPWVKINSTTVLVYLVNQSAADWIVKIKISGTTVTFSKVKSLGQSNWQLRRPCMLMLSNTEGIIAGPPQDKYFRYMKFTVSGETVTFGSAVDLALDGVASGNVGQTEGFVLPNGDCIFFLGGVRFYVILKTASDYSLIKGDYFDPSGDLSDSKHLSKPFQGNGTFVMCTYDTLKLYNVVNDTMNVVHSYDYHASERDVIKGMYYLNANSFLTIQSDSTGVYAQVYGVFDNKLSPGSRYRISTLTSITLEDRSYYINNYTEQVCIRVDGRFFMIGTININKANVGAMRCIEISLPSTAVVNATGELDATILGVANNNCAAGDVVEVIIPSGHQHKYL